MDEAFKSRVHVSLRYPSLDLVSTKKLWEKTLDRIERQNDDQAVKVVFRRESLLEFAEQHYIHCEKTKSTWNGRQIRNAFQTALSLGRHERLKKLKQKGIPEAEAERMGKKKYLRLELTRENFQKIARMDREFEDYMINVRGSDVLSARDEYVRNDEFDPEVPLPQKDYSGLPAAIKRMKAKAAIKPATGQLEEQQVKPEVTVKWSLDASSSMGTAGEKPESDDEEDPTTSKNMEKSEDESSSDDNF